MSVIQSDQCKKLIELSYDKIRTSWSKAIELFNSRLTKDEKKKIDLKNVPQAQFADLLAAAQTAKTKVEQARYPWTGALQRVLGQVNHYAVVGDIIVQHHAEYTSLVWGTVRFLLLVGFHTAIYEPILHAQFAVEEQKSSEKLSNALESIIQIVFRAEEYARLFSTRPDTTTDRIFQSLQDNLTQLYAEVLNFLVRTTLFFRKPTLRKIASSGRSRETD